MINKEKNESIQITLPKELLKAIDDFIGVLKERLNVKGINRSKVIQDSIILYFDFVASRIKEGYEDKKEKEN